ncbi:hypothetical protein M8998_13030 [Sphingobacterium sp. lm-10]|uniref:hypothetical protein n=1 Tax=Sphingobacterium sp. lm-10 TaxID=2944904 RepID=UPI0020228B7A|nr:hypothetical protein [Sphingobacterium sp. lm-10]MCL7988867.1 hypothetical protein [Sphingobacterium sp. lm-10]
MFNASSILLLKRLGLLVFVVSMLSCQKDPRSASGLSDETYTINFNVQEAMLSVADRNASSGILSQQAAGLDGLVDYVYFWSFNNESLRADIAIQPGATITYNDGLEPTSFAAGWPFEQFPAGRALSINGVKELTIALPTHIISSLTNMGFDISSSATGPKAFDLHYSYDDMEWHILRNVNQFSNFTTSQARNSFLFDLSNLDLSSTDIIRFRLVSAAGERGGGSEYNENTGVLRLDNLRFQGTVQAAKPQEGDQLRIYAFDQATGDLASSLIQEYALDMPAISMNLPHGEYRFSFLRHTGLSDILLPAYVSSSNTYYFGNRFSAYAGEVYGFEKSIFINQNIQESVVLDRYHSQIKFEFTDARDLSIVESVVIVRMEEPAFYAPFNLQLANPVLDQSEIEMHPNLALSKELQFNQFIGRVVDPVPLSYQLMAFGKSGELLRVLDVSVAVRNNVQVLFRGELLGFLPFQAGFQVEINEEWDETVEVQF